MNLKRRYSGHHYRLRQFLWRYHLRILYGGRGKHNRKIEEEYQIKYSTKNLPIIDIALTEFMSAVFKEFHRRNLLWGDSTNIIRISEEPLVYRIILYKSENPMHAVRFDEFMRRVFELARLSNCMDEFLQISYVEWNKWITNTGEYEQYSVMSELTHGNKGRELFVGKPKGSERYTSQQLEDMGINGIYQYGGVDENSAE